MAVRIRLNRMGAKKNPFYRIIVADSRSPRSGRFIDILGYYNPTTDPIELKFDEEKTIDWLKKGANPSDTVKALMDKAGITSKFEEAKKNA